MTYLSQSQKTWRFGVPTFPQLLSAILRKIAEADRRHREIWKLKRTSLEHLEDMGIDPAKITELYRT